MQEAEKQANFTLTTLQYHQLQSNGPILTERTTLKRVMPSVAKSETGAIHHNRTYTVPIRIILNELSHPQGSTPLKTDNNISAGFLKYTIRQKHSKPWYMNLHWMKDRILQKEFWVYWDKGYNSRGYYFTKYHPPRHHKLMRPKYIFRS